MPISIIGTAALDTSGTGQGGIPFPSGTSAQRPSGVAPGTVRFNTTLGRLETFNTSNTWVNPSTGYASDLGLNSANPAVSAEQIIANGNSYGDGDYWIKNAAGAATQVYCDMTNGGWMYLIPPTVAVNSNGLGYAYTQSASETSCITNQLEDIGSWEWLYGYRCGGSNISLNFTWTNFLNASQVRYCAVIGGGNSYSFTLNGTGVGPDYTNSANRFWTSAAVTTCNTNVCWRDSTRATELKPKVARLDGNLTIAISASTACQPDCTWGVSYWLGKVAVK